MLHNRREGWWLKENAGEKIALHTKFLPVTKEKSHFVSQ